jgi:hypothetical protein
MSTPETLAVGLEGHGDLHGGRASALQRETHDESWLKMSFASSDELLALR